MKKIGIIGGMGPQAGLDLCDEIIKNTKVEKDQDHVPFLLYNLPQIPSRVDALAGTGEDPVPMLVEASEALVNAGAEFLLFACNTAHVFLPYVKAQIDTPIVDIIDATWEAIHALPEKVKKVGALGRTATIKTRVFEKGRNGIEVVYADDNVQESNVEKAIIDIKINGATKRSRKLVIEAIKHLQSKGADAVILGCTELPLVVKKCDTCVKLIDPTQLLAQKAIKLSKGELSFRDLGYEKNISNVVAHYHFEYDLR